MDSHDRRPQNENPDSSGLIYPVPVIGVGSARAEKPKRELLHQDLTDKIIGCLISVHTVLGPGLPERSYQKACALEFVANGIKFVREPSFEVIYRNVLVGHHRPDFIVENKVVLELKCVSRFEPVFTTQVVTYLRISKLQVGLLVNFNVPSLNYGIKRVAL